MKSHNARASMMAGKESAMSRRTKFLLGALPAALVLQSCAPPEQGSVFIEGAVPLDPPQCTVTAAGNVFRPNSILDIGVVPEAANSLIVPVKVRTNLPATFNTQDVTQDQQRSPNYPNYGAADNNIITFTESEVFLTTDSDRDGPALTGNGLPLSDGNPRVSSVGGTVFNQQTQLSAPNVIFVQAITTADAALLQEDPFIADQLAGDPTKSIRVTTNIRVKGITTGGSEVRSPPFPFQVELCQGCLTTRILDCDPLTPGEQPAVQQDVCNPGQDFPLFACE